MKQEKTLYIYKDVFRTPKDSDKFCIELEDIKLYFSSELNMSLYEKNFDKNKNKIKYWTDIYANGIDIDLLSIIYTYEKAEKRGFRIKIKNNEEWSEILCKEEMEMVVKILY